jgi:hypothetical protein
MNSASSAISPLRLVKVTNSHRLWFENTEICNSSKKRNKLPSNEHQPAFLTSLEAKDTPELLRCSLDHSKSSGIWGREIIMCVTNCVHF